MVGDTVGLDQQEKVVAPSVGVGSQGRNTVVVHKGLAGVFKDHGAGAGDDHQSAMELIWERS